jgi:hypothetical protein
VSQEGFADTALLGEAREWLRQEAQVGAGASCPCCTQHTKVYRRPLNANMARLLIAFYRAAGRDWAHRGIIEDKTGDLAKLRYWGLIEEDPAKREDGGRAGWWKVTDLGEEFVRRIAKVPKHALIFDGRLRRLDDSSGYVTITDTLGKKFNYSELMTGVPPVYDPTLLEGDN